MGHLSRQKLQQPSDTRHADVWLMPLVAGAIGASCHLEAVAFRDLDGFLFFWNTEPSR